MPLPCSGNNEGDSAEILIVGAPGVGRHTLAQRLVNHDAPSEAHAGNPDRWIIDTKYYTAEARLSLASCADEASLADARVAEALLLVLDACDPDSWTAARAWGEAADLDACSIRLCILNKADLLPPQQREKVLARLQAAVRESLPQVPGVACLWTSATTGEGLGALMPAMEATYLEWNRRIGTGELNRWMAKFKARQAGSGSSTGLAKIKYITQIKRRPPTFSAFLSGSKVDAGNSATRFLTNAIREDYGIFSVPLRIFLRASGRDRPPPSKSKSKRARR
mmetsp:Transcript_25156/g.63392  ORF Transcript_25156/g.63392 Transcript_25156/m.63392 type:complete len:280 (-) Transcript_25156:318-1157(-)